MLAFTPITLAELCELLSNILQSMRIRDNHVRQAKLKRRKVIRMIFEEFAICGLIINRSQ
jgi:hypothetical protein